MNAFQKLVGVLLIIILIVLAVFFYWFQIRPADIRTKCSNDAMEKSVALYQFNSEPDTTKRTILQENMERTLYSSCLHEKGLDK